jgi:aminoglycoside phosphotransferase (APT) family kinase protein
MPSGLPAGINAAALSRFFVDHVPGASGPFDYELIAGGRSNLTYRVVAGGRSFVLRRPPLGHVLPTAHDMAREFRVLSALSPTDVPVPQTIALCEDNSVNGTPFYVMEYCEGMVIGEEMPEGYAETPAERRALSMAVADTLAKLHAVDYNAVGLGDFGRPEGYLERQVRRWGEQWERSKTRELAEIDEAIRRLKNAIPVSPAPTIVHGDYRIGNMILGLDDPGRVVALLDWEMATLGDPLSDLGYTLIYWVEPGDSEKRIEAVTAGDITTREGFMTRAELIAEYARRSGQNVEHIDFYVALAFYKLAVICEGINARWLSGETVGDGFEPFGRRAELLAQLAVETADQSADPRLRG